MNHFFARCCPKLALLLLGQWICWVPFSLAQGGGGAVGTDPSAASWTPVEPFALEVVAETGMIAPVLFPVPFTNFRYPHTDGEGAEIITCIADDPVKFREKSKPLAHGVYRFDTAGGVKPFHVAGFTENANGRKADYIRALQTDGERFVFLARFPYRSGYAIGLIQGDEVTYPVDTALTRLADGGRFRWVWDPDTDDSVAFVGGSSRTQGVHLLDEDQLLTIADTRTSLPGLFEGTFRDFQKWIVNEPPWILFVASAHDYIGIFAYNRDNDRLYRLCDSRFLIEGKTPAFFEMGSNPLVNDSVAVMIRFADKTSGVYLLRLDPGFSFARAAPPGL